MGEVMMRQKTLLLDRRSPSRRVTGRNENPSMELPRARKCPGSACSSGCSEEYETRRVFFYMKHIWEKLRQRL